jgi:hypothetical protein
MLEDMYVAKKINRYGEPYGFVKISNVRDVTKMTKALNVVWFGQFRVCASVAKFDRNAVREETRPEVVQVGLTKRDDRNSSPRGRHQSKVGKLVPSQRRQGQRVAGLVFRTLRMRNLGCRWVI